MWEEKEISQGPRSSVSGGHAFHISIYALKERHERALARRSGRFRQCRPSFRSDRLPREPFRPPSRGRRSRAKKTSSEDELRPGSPFLIPERIVPCPDDPSRFHCPSAAGSAPYTHRRIRVLTRRHGMDAVSDPRFPRVVRLPPPPHSAALALLDGGWLTTHGLHIRGLLDSGITPAR